MHKTLARLYRDHLNSNRLMDILEGQLEVLKFTKPLPAKLMSEIVSYVREYTDKIHHPIEDHLYQVLLARTDRGHDEMEELLGQHLIVVDLTRKMLQAVDSADGGDNDSIDRLIEAGRELISHQRNHMNFEDRGVAIFAKVCFGHPSPSKQQKLNATVYACGAPTVLRTLRNHLFAALHNSLSDSTPT